MDQYLFLETLPSCASESAKHLQLSRIRSRAAAIGHRKSMSKRTVLDNAQTVPGSQEQGRGIRTGVYRMGPSPQYLRQYLTKNSRDSAGPEFVGVEPGEDTFEHWQLVEEFNVRPQSLLSANRTDPFGTYPASKPEIGVGRLLDFGKPLTPNSPQLLMRSMFSGQRLDSYGLPY